MSLRRILARSDQLDKIVVYEDVGICRVAVLAGSEGVKATQTGWPPKNPFFALDSGVHRAGAAADAARS